MVLKDKTKNKASYRSLPLLPTIATALKKHKNQINKNKLICGNTYSTTANFYAHLEDNYKLFSADILSSSLSFILTTPSGATLWSQ